MSMGTRKKNNPQPKDEIRKRVAQKQITFQALKLAGDDPAKRIANGQYGVH
jgi:hypothetical protein